MVAGKALFDWANQRGRFPSPSLPRWAASTPSSCYPASWPASGKRSGRRTLPGSITLGVGQFCTNPGLIIGRRRPGSRPLYRRAGRGHCKVSRAPCCTRVSPKPIRRNAERPSRKQDVATVAVSGTKPQSNQGVRPWHRPRRKPSSATRCLHQEVFGPYSLVIQCKMSEEMLAVARHLEGQLTASLMATDQDILDHPDLVQARRISAAVLSSTAYPPASAWPCPCSTGAPSPPRPTAALLLSARMGSNGGCARSATRDWPDHLLPDALQERQSPYASGEPSTIT
jgi:alpha-ketoglutaric semialdehyde dehydrogenase